MALDGTLIQFDRETLAIQYDATLYNEPKTVRQIWPLGYYKFSGMSYCDLAAAIGKPARIDQGRVSVYLGNGNYLTGDLLNGGKTQSIKTETLDVPRPKCRTETRWHDGRWEKLWRKGWVPA